MPICRCLFVESFLSEVSDSASFLSVPCQMKHQRSGKGASCYGVMAQSQQQFFLVQCATSPVEYLSAMLVLHSSAAGGQCWRRAGLLSLAMGNRQCKVNSCGSGGLLCWEVMLHSGNLLGCRCAKLGRQVQTSGRPASPYDDSFQGCWRYHSWRE